MPCRVKAVRLYDWNLGNFIGPEFVSGITEVKFIRSKQLDGNSLNPGAERNPHAPPLAKGEGGAICYSLLVTHYFFMPHIKYGRLKIARLPSTWMVMGTSKVFSIS
jgi:hypothetical protein